MNPIYHRAQFLTSAPSLRELPRGIEREVAFGGRSNAGKSSALNAITQQKSLARTSKTPGRTQLLNVFGITDTRALVDLPGYGYARVTDATRARWEQALPEYFRKREALRGLMLIMDIRHPLTEHDQAMLALAERAGVPVHILLTKSDKLNRGPAMNALQKVRQQLNREHPNCTVQLFSATNGTGLDEAHAMLDAWLFSDEPST